MAMRTAAIRTKLSEYISVADDEKIKAMYVLFKNDINSGLAWWQNDDLIAEFDADHKNWKEGKMKGHSIEDVRKTIKELKLKRDSQ